MLILIYLFKLIMIYSLLSSFSNLMFLDSRLEKKEEESLGELSQALQEERDMRKSLEAQVWVSLILFFFIWAMTL